MSWASSTTRYLNALFCATHSRQPDNSHNANRGGGRRLRVVVVGRWLRRRGFNDGPTTTNTNSATVDSVSFRTNRYKSCVAGTIMFELRVMRPRMLLQHATHRLNRSCFAYSRWHKKGLGRIRNDMCAFWHSVLPRAFSF